MNIGIISLGLIGGSVLKSLKNCEEYTLYAVTRNKKTIEEAKLYTPNISDDINTLKNCDVIFVCSPMSKVEEILDSLEKVVSPRTIVADVSSLKEFVTQKERPYIFIGTHPMAGTEHCGFESAFENLFEDAKWVITPSKLTDKSAISTLSSIIKKTGAQVITAEAKEHDKAVALISHMPMFLAQALMKTAQNNPLAMKLASSGFKDMTRLAMSNTTMAQDMIALNNKNILTAINELEINSQKLMNDNYPKEIEEIKTIRQKMYNQNGKNVF